MPSRGTDYIHGAAAIPGLWLSCGVSCPIPGGAENIYTAFIRAHGYGLHHFCFFVRDIKPYVAEYEKRGWVVTQNGVINGKSTKSHFAYLTRPGDETGTVVEFGDTHWGFLRMTRSKLNMALGVLTGNAVRIR